MKDNLMAVNFNLPNLQKWVNYVATNNSNDSLTMFDYSSYMFSLPFSFDLYMTGDSNHFTFLDLVS